jgi:hypothetical protein
MKAAIVVLLLCASTTARAQHAEAFLAADGRDNTLRAYFEMDPTMGIGLGYVRAVDVRDGTFARRIGLHFDVATIIGFSSWDLTVGASMRVVEHTGFDLLVAVDLETKILQNDVHTGAALGYGVALRPGYFDPAWYLSLDLAMRGTMATALSHRDAYREQFPGVRDGLVATDHLNLFAGASIGFCIEGVFLAGARFAWRMPRTFEDYAPYFLPYTIDIEVGVRF